MEKENLPLLLGLDYEQWEFSLEVLDKEDILGMDNYLYLEDISFLGAVPKSVEMLFSLDILQVVRIIYEFDNQKELDKFYKEITVYFKNNTKNCGYDVYTNDSQERRTTIPQRYLLKSRDMP